MHATWHVTMVVVCVLLSASLNSARQDTAPHDIDTVPISRYGWCYQERDAACNATRYTATSRPDGIRWTLLDRLTGRYDVTFHFPICNAAYFIPDLYVREVTEEECGEMTTESFKHIHIHSKYRRLKVSDNSSDTPCNQRGTFSFHSMFTACYLLTITPTTTAGGSHQKTIDRPRYFTTDYVKRLIANDPKNTSAHYFITPQFYPSERHLTIKTNMTEYPWNALSATASSITYRLQLVDERDNASFDATWTLHTQRTPTTNSTCSFQSRIRPTCERVLDGGNDRVIFTFTDVLHGGNYVLLPKVDDDRCFGDTIWTHGGLNCDWPLTFKVNVPNNSLTSDNVTPVIDSDKIASDKHVSLIILGVVFGFAVTCIAAVTIIYRHHYPPPGKQHGALVSSPLLEATTSRQTGVLLIYARDCQPFMELMAAFRRLLQHQAGFEVIDPFDPHYWEAISCRPTEWIRHHLSHPRTKVIVVATRCASLRQRYVDTTRYRTPNAQDWVYNYALQALTRQVTCDSYSKYFVVRFHGFGTDADLFDGLNINTRYVLPTHLDSFVRGLDPLFTNTLTGSEELRQLHDNLKQLVAYTTLNNNYLDGMLEDTRVNIV